MPEKAPFQDKQYAFAAHLRDPDNVPAPEGIEERRMAVYRELFFNNLFSRFYDLFDLGFLNFSRTRTPGCNYLFSDIYRIVRPENIGIFSQHHIGANTTSNFFSQG